MDSLRPVAVVISALLIIIAAGFLTGFISLGPSPYIHPDFAYPGPVSVSPNVVSVGQQVTFTVKYRDTYDYVHMLVCRDDRGVKPDRNKNFICIGGQWCSAHSQTPGGRSFDNFECTTTISPTENYFGRLTYNIYLCDSFGLCEGPKSGYFTVQK